MIHFFSTNAKSVSLFSFAINCNFFDKIRKRFTLFRQNAKSVPLFSTKCEKCFIFIYRVRKVFEFFFVKMQKLSGVFYLCTVYNVSSFFPNMCAIINQVS